jgi:hypothetical protein
VNTCRTCNQPITDEHPGWRSGDSAWFHDECPAPPFKQALADHLTGRWAPFGNTVEWKAADITGIDVNWSDGEQGTDDYGDEFIRQPYLEIYVSGTEGRRTQADTGWCIETLMRQACGLDLNP